MKKLTTTLLATAAMGLAAVAIASPPAPVQAEVSLASTASTAAPAPVEEAPMSSVDDAVALGSGAKCVWEGKAPACNGKCKSGFKSVKRDKKGDGKACVTGTKVKCCPAAHVITRGKGPFCNGKCKSGEVRVGDSKTGENGKKCTTGKAAICLR